jgi:Neprosin
MRRGRSLKAALALVMAVAVATAGSAQASPLEVPVARYAPKGRPPQRTGAPRAFDGVEYLYVGTREAVLAHTSGAGATITQADPAIGISDFHSLAEIAIESLDDRQIVEIGWNIDHGVNGDLQPHVFSFHWVDGQPTCYNACGWVQVSPDKRPGMRVVPGEPHRYEIKLVGDDWWLFYDGEGMGYYPHTEWKSGFKTVALTQWFGEVAAAVPAPCTQMGNGATGGDTTAASFSDLHVFDPDGVTVPAAYEMGALTNPAFYNIGRATPTGFGFGGPGAGTGCCTPSTCTAMRAECGTIVDPVCAGNMLACGACSGADVCTVDHTCPGGFGPRDDGEAFDAPVDSGSGGCCDAGRAANGLGALGLGALVALALGRRPPRRPHRHWLDQLKRRPLWWGR